MRIMRGFIYIISVLCLFSNGASALTNELTGVEKKYGKRLKFDVSKSDIKSRLIQSSENKSIYHFEFESAATGKSEQTIYGVRWVRYSNSGVFLIVDLYQDDKRPVSKVYVMGREIMTLPAQISAESIYDNTLGVMVYVEGRALAYTFDRYGNVDEYDLQLLEGIPFPSIKFTPDMKWVYTSHNPDAVEHAAPNSFHFRMLSKTNLEPAPWRSLRFDESKKVTSVGFESDKFFGAAIDGNMYVWNDTRVPEIIESPAGIRYNYIYRSEDPSYYIATNGHKTDWCILSGEFVELGCIGKKNSKSKKYYGVGFPDDLDGTWLNAVNIDGGYLQVNRQSKYPYKYRKKLKLSSIIKDKK